MRKSLLIVLSVIMIAVIVTACSGGGNNTPQNTNTGGAEPTETNTNANVNQPEDDGEKPVLRQLMQYNRFDPNDYYVGTFLKEATGYEVKYDQLPVENFDEKLNLLMANQEPYDFMKLNPIQFAHLASSGALEPLDELVETYGTNMKQVISESSWNGAKVNGQIMAIPESSASGLTLGYALLYRQDWLEELNLQAPTNLDELYNVLKEVKDKKNVIPMTGGKDPFQGEIGSALGWDYGLDTQFKEQDGKIIHMVEDPTTKDYLAYMNKLYTEGLLDAEWAINQSNTLIEKFTGGKAFMYREGWWNAANINNAMATNFPDAKIGILPYLKDSEGNASARASGGITFYIAIPKWAPNKEEAMKYLDLKLDEEIFKEATIGKEGVHHEVQDGKYFPILPIFDDQYNFGSDYLTGNDEEKYPVYWQARVRKNEFVQNYFETFQENGKDIMYYDALTFAPPIENISKHKQKLHKYVEDEFIKFITGAESLDNYDRFVEQWRADGGDEMIQAANDWFATVQ
ncbi:extracellular solute-binding protein [Paenibacillus abyssi]|uniref:Sugar ABC transporter substrate-binding protein n=1 Tax=Paenibacillus abyssi TaxID=1340531 RepID=A0A917CPJ8_9BACL|nr:extracellular solute-binding protein [Paenibacillus abyssi]GGF94448.1 sugar ABC transporter substrate-binding protein [Paenibacillus abyssi]